MNETHRAPRNQTLLISTLLLTLSWCTRALVLVPWVRDLAVREVIAGGTLQLRGLWPVPPHAAVGAVVASLAGLVGPFGLRIGLGRSGGLAGWIDQHLDSHLWITAFSTVVAGVTGIALLASGDPTVLDAKSHVARGWLWAQYLRAGALPIWTDLWYGGFPFEQHYPPLSHLFQAMLGAIGIDPFSSVKLMCWVSRILGSVGFATLCWSVHRSPRAAALGALIYALAPPAHAVVMMRGRFPGALFLGILPWAFVAIEYVIRGARPMRAGAMLALLIWGLVLTHSGQARLALALLLLFTVIRLAPWPRAGSVSGATWLGLGVGWGVGGALTLAALIPVLLDGSVISEAVPYNFGGRWGPQLPALSALPSLLRWGPTSRDYLGISTVLLGAVGLWNTRRQRGGGCVGSFGLLGFSAMPWFLVYPTDRNVDFLLFGTQLSAAASCAGTGPIRMLGPTSPLTAAFVLVLIDAGPLNLISSYVTHRGAREATYQRLEGRIGGQRLLELPIERDGRLRPNLWYCVPNHAIATVAGPNSQAAPLDFAYQCAMVDTTANALSTHQALPREVVALLAYQNVGYIVAMALGGPVIPEFTAAPGIVVEQDLPGLRVQHASPVAVLSPGTPTAPSLPRARLTVSGLERRASRESATEQLAWIATARPTPVEGASMAVLPNRAVITIPDVGHSTIRIARSGYRSTRVRLDGADVPWEQGPLGGIALDVEPGPHRIDIEGLETPLRQALRRGQLVVAGLLLLVLVGRRRR